ncbi:MAG: mechanosensitive ion channel, partial [Chroococcidiopsidaceae cyanobacterium CP_BM_ER_R8_30]|nr:mechanosensitive ion channel [Chroococcidiopsidaceae cyanobacterium CP_BM_ER_R8_30]
MMKYLWFQRIKGLLILVFIVFWIAIAASLVNSQESEPVPAPPTHQAPVLLGDEIVILLHNGIGSFSVQDRATAVSNRLSNLANNPTVQEDSLQIVNKPDGPIIVVGNQAILSVTAADAKSVGQTQEALANEDRLKMVASIQRYQKKFLRSDLFTSLTSMAAVTSAFIVIFLILIQIFPRIYARIKAWEQTHAMGMSADEARRDPVHRITSLLIGSLTLLKLGLLLILMVIYAIFIFSQFSWSARLAASIQWNFLTTLTTIGHELLASIPNLLIIALAVVLCRIVILLVNTFFDAIDRGQLTIPRFYPEWAKTTAQLLSLLILGFTLALLFPLIPGYNSDAFKGFSVLFGLLITLGSAGAVANFLAGILLIYSRAFRVGDYVKIADSTGCVIDKTLLVIRIRTVENEIVTLTNTQVLNTQIINYSASDRDHAVSLMLHTSITLGYDVPLEKVHKALIAAAY